MENVDELAGALHKEALDALLHQLAMMGYDVQTFIIDAADYGVPEHKERMWIMGLRRPNKLFHIKDFTRFFQDVQTLLEKKGALER